MHTIVIGHQLNNYTMHITLIKNLTEIHQVYRYLDIMLHIY